MSCSNVITKSMCETVEQLLAQAGVSAEFLLRPITGGANNRVFRVDAGERHYLLKQYFRHPSDPRDRLGAEFAFTSYAWNAGVRALPQPLAQDENRGMALYEFIQGTPLQAGQVTSEHVRQAMMFYDAINDRRGAHAATRLPEASEACFSLQQHMDLVQRRIDRLYSFSCEAPVEDGITSFIDAQLIPAWYASMNFIRQGAKQAGLSLEEPLPEGDRRLSPSDFGFHNAILTSDGILRFVDFEYAGWDDPAKLVCDFFCQPAVPVPVIDREFVIQSVTKNLSNPTHQRERIALLSRAYRVKWACIVLNQVLPVGMQRRVFAGIDLPTGKQIESKLTLAKQLLTRPQEQV